MNKKLTTSTFEMKIMMALLLSFCACSFLGCASMKEAMGVQQVKHQQGPIQNPFYDFTSSSGTVNSNHSKGDRDSIVLRTKKGDRSVEVELPNSSGNLSDFVVPMAPAFASMNSKSGQNSSGLESPGASAVVDERYRERTPGMSDREIMSTLPRVAQGQEGVRREVETGLGVIQSEQGTPDRDHSYLAAVDHIKQLYRAARYEAALIEMDELLREYPTDSKLYEMRGTLFERTGRTDLALRSWVQAMHLDSNNESLKKFVERKQARQSAQTTQREPAAKGEGKP